jgi:DNA-binding NtrC family response regulator
MAIIPGNRCAPPTSTGVPDNGKVLADVVMPVMNGVAMMNPVKKHRHDIRVGLMTVFSEPVIDAFYGAKFPLIRKPFLPDDLVRVVKANIDPPAASA